MAASSETDLYRRRSNPCSVTAYKLLRLERLDSGSRVLLASHLSQPAENLGQTPRHVVLQLIVGAWTWASRKRNL